MFVSVSGSCRSASISVFWTSQTYNGHVHSVGVGVREVTEQEERVVFGQAARVVEVAQLKADVLHRCSLHGEKNTVERTPGAVQELASVCTS